METNDMELLRAYARDGSEQAFRSLVERHINVVYAVALRHTDNGAMAEDVTQAVFTALAEKAASLPKGTLLAGWLFRATRFAAANARRAEARREHWEQKAAQMDSSSTASAPEPDVESIEPFLHEALEKLPEPDRSAIILRFFEKKSLDEIGRILGTTESAAKMRLSRAVEKLRQLFRKCGVAVPASLVVTLLTAQAAQAAPVGLAGSIASTALLHQSSTSTLLLAKGALKFMAQTQIKKAALAAIVALFAGTAAVVVQTPSHVLAQAKDVPAASAKSPSAAPTVTSAKSKVLIFRNQPSWNRNPDFEETLSDLGMEFAVEQSSAMATEELAPYRAVVIPGAQWRTDFYQTMMDNAPRFERYVTNGGVLILELNGAEDSGVLLPGGVTMSKHGSKDNTILLPLHPAVIPFNGQHIRASFASHGFLENVPTNALVLAVETTDDKPDLTRPTYVEYPLGRGRVIAACQCFHDRDKSGRGVLMPTLLSYATTRKWYLPPKNN